MQSLQALQSQPIFAITVATWELVLRGSLVFWFLFIVFRFVMRRDVSSLGLADVLVLVLIADASQNAMAGGYTSVTDGVILISTIVGWNFVLDWAAYRFAWARKLAEPPAILLVRRGQVVWANLRREMMTLDDLRAKLREQGVADIARVKQAFLEGDGVVTVIPYDGGRGPTPTHRAPPEHHP